MTRIPRTIRSTRALPIHDRSWGPCTTWTLHQLIAREEIPRNQHPIDRVILSRLHSCTLHSRLRHHHRPHLRRHLHPTLPSHRRPTGIHRLQSELIGCSGCLAMFSMTPGWHDSDNRDISTLSDTIGDSTTAVWNGIELQRPFSTPCLEQEEREAKVNHRLLRSCQLNLRLRPHL